MTDRVPEQCQLRDDTTRDVPTGLSIWPKKFERKKDVPQKVVPRANHWAPAAIAKMIGCGERMMPATEPKTRPETPVVC